MSEIQSVAPPDPRPILAELDEHGIIRCTDLATHAEAQRRLVVYATIARRITETFAPAKSAAHEAHKRVCALENRALARVSFLRGQQSEEVGRWEREERERAYQESARQQEIMRREEEERRLEEAIKAEAAGDKQAADAIMAAPVIAPAVIVAPEIARVEGVSKRTSYKVVVFDLYALACHIAQHPNLIHFLKEHQAALDASARAQRMSLQLPGCRVEAVISHPVRVKPDGEEGTW